MDIVKGCVVGVYDKVGDVRGFFMGDFGFYNVVCFGMGEIVVVCLVFGVEFVYEGNFVCFEGFKENIVIVIVFDLDCVEVICVVV